MEKPVFLNARQVRDRYGVSDMSVWRWQHHPEMKFPPPVYFGRLRFWRLADLEAWEAAQAKTSAPEVA